MQPVLSLVEDDRSFRFEHLVGDFQGAQAIFLIDFLPKFRTGVMERGQTVHEFRGRVLRQSYELAEQVWKAAGRAGKPRFVAGMYWGLGPNAAQRAGEYIRHYYAFLGPMAEQIASSVSSTPEAVKERIQAFADVGVDELICWPCIPDLDQVDRLAELIG